MYTVRLDLGELKSSSLATFYTDFVMRGEAGQEGENDIQKSRGMWHQAHSSQT